MPMARIPFTWNMGCARIVRNLWGWLWLIKRDNSIYRALNIIQGTIFWYFLWGCLHSSFEQPNAIATIFLLFFAYSCRKVSKNDKFAAKSNNFWEFMLDIVEKVLTLQRIWENKQFPAIRKWEIMKLSEDDEKSWSYQRMRNHEDNKGAGFLFHSLHL